MASENSNNYDAMLAKVKRGHRITTDVINFFCGLYAQAKELSKQQAEMGIEIKVALLRDKEMVAAPPDCPYMLKLTVTDPKPFTTTTVNWEAIARHFAEAVYGKEYEAKKSWKMSVAAGTKTTTTTAESQVRLNPPAMNPDYKEVRR